MSVGRRLIASTLAGCCAAGLALSGCTSGPQGPDFGPSPGLAAFLRTAERFSGPFTVRIEADDRISVSRWDGHNSSFREPAADGYETRYISGVGCFSRSEGRWAWNEVVGPPRASPFGLVVATGGVETYTSTGLRDPGARSKREGDDLLVDVPDARNGEDQVTRAVVHLDGGHLDTITWFDGDRVVATATFSFDPVRVERPAHAEEGIDVQC